MKYKPRRPRQLHLSTAIVLMLVAGGALWLNLKIVERKRIESIAGHTISFPVVECGWPLIYAFNSQDLFSFRLGGNHIWTWDYLCLGIDVCVAIVLLACCALLSEHLIRRREPRAP